MIIDKRVYLYFIMIYGNFDVLAFVKKVAIGEVADYFFEKYIGLLP